MHGASSLIVRTRPFSYRRTPIRRIKARSGDTVSVRAVSLAEDTAQHGTL